MQRPQQRSPNAPASGRRLLLAAALVAALASVSLAAAQSTATQSGLLVQGTGAAYGTPDQAVLTLGVEVVDTQVQTALNHADTTMGAVRSVFLSGGVDAKDIRTAAFDVWREDVRDNAGNITGERYHVVETYQVTVRSLANVGSLLADAVQAGANSIQGIRFGIQDTAALERQARAAAMQDARSRAEQLASLAGATLGRPVSIAESTSAPSMPVPMLRAQAMGGPAAPVQGGQLAVQVRVTVRYALR